MMTSFEAHNALDAVGDGVICTNGDLVVTFINKMGCRILGKTEAMVLGSPLENVMAIQTDQNKFVSEVAETVLMTGVPKGLRAGSYIFTDTKRIYLSASFTRMNTEQGYGLVINFRDITRLKQLEFDFVREKEKFESLFQNMPLGVFVINLDRQVQYYNPYVEEKFGHVSDMGQLLGTLVHCKYGLDRGCGKGQMCQQCEIRQNIERIRHNLPFSQSQRHQFIHIYGGVETVRDYQVEYAKISDEADSNVMLIVQDITEQCRYEEKLDAARKEAQNASKLKSQFLANMSHEIRTPLNGIIGMIDLTRHMLDDEELIDNLKTAKTSSEGLLRIINDVLDYSKLEADKMVFRKKSFNIEAFVQEIVRENSFEAKLRGLYMNMEIEPEVSGSIVSDKLRLKQVFTNLIGNSIKFTETGGVTLSICKGERHGDLVELVMKVRDTGIGIDESQKEVLFQSFTQVDGSYTRTKGGTGLGLAISKEIVERLGGSITFNSTLGVGTEFVIVMPFEIGKGWQEEISENAVSADNAGRILLVEDDRINQMVLQKKLVLEGHEVVLAADGQEGLQIFNSKRFDLVIMDIQMPVMSGTKAVDAMRKTDAGKTTPIVALTALALEEEKGTIMKHGFDMYISKPVDLNYLSEVTNKMLNLKPDYRYQAPCRQPEQVSALEVKIDHLALTFHLANIKRCLDDRLDEEIEAACDNLKDYFEDSGQMHVKMLVLKMVMAARKCDMGVVKTQYEVLMETLNKS